MRCGESVPALDALWGAGKPVVFLSLSRDRSQHRRDISFYGSSEKIVRTVSHEYVVHFLNSIRTENSHV